MNTPHVAVFDLDPMLTPDRLMELRAEIKASGTDAGLLVVRGDWVHDGFTLACLEITLEFGLPVGRFAVLVDGEIDGQLAMIVWCRVGPVFVTENAVAGGLAAIPDDAPIEFTHEALQTALAARPEASRKALGHLLRHGRMTGPELAGAGLAELVDDVEQARERFARQLTLTGE